MRSLRYFSAIVAVTVLLAGCGKRAEPVVIGSGSENAAFYPAIEAFAKSKGQTVTFVSKGSVDLANDLAQGTAAPYDVVWTASSSVLDGIKGHAVKDLMSVSVSPVMPIVKRSKAESFGWTKKSFTNADFYEAVTAGKLKFGMTSASQSFSGQAAYLGMLSSLSGNPEVLQASDLDAKGIAERTAAILKKVARSSASSGTLKTFMVANFDSYDAMLNYEGLAFEANRELAQAGKKDTFCALMPADGVVVADHPVGYVDKGDAKKAAFYKELAAYLKSPEFRQILKDNGRRAEMGLLASTQKSAYDPCWDTDRPIKQVTMPTSEVVAKAVDLYQSALRKPSLTIYVADFSGSMSQSTGERDLKAAMRAVFDPVEARKWNLQPTAKDVNVFIPFSHAVWSSIEVRGNDPKAYAAAIAKIESLRADGGTEMYLGLNAALTVLDRFPNLSDYAVSIVLMTDGVSKNDGANQALNGLARVFKERGVAAYSILFGEADQTQLINIASHQVGGNEELAKAYVCDGRKDLVGCFRKVRANNWPPGNPGERKTMKETLRGIVSGLTAAAGCLGAYVPLHLSLGISLGVGAAVFVGTYLVIPRKKGADEVVIDTNAGLTEADREDVVAKIDAYRSEMLASKLAFERLGHPKTAEKIDRVIKLVDAIADRTKRKPAEIPRVESFADYHLARVSKLTSEYADIADGLQTDRIRTEIEKLKGILDVVADGFEDFYEKLKLRRMDDLRIDGEAYMAVLNFEKDWRMNSRLVGLGGGVLLLATVGLALTFWDNASSNPDAFKRVDTVEIKGKATKEFVALCENPKIREILRKNHKVVPTCVQATSSETVAANAAEGGQDFLIPASDLIASTYPGKSLQTQPVFSTPLIAFTRSSHAEALVTKGYATKQSDGSLLLPFVKVADLVATKAAWKSVGINEYGPVKVRGTALESTTSGQALVHLLVAAFNNDEPVTVENVPALTLKIKPIVDRLGQLPKTTNDLLNVCLSTGCTDLNFGLESTYLRIVHDFADGDENSKKSAEAMKKNLTVLYPQPAAWGHHTMIVLTEGGRRFLNALSDPEIQAIAWTEHGLRTPGQGIRMDSKSAPVPGVATSIGAAVTQPTAEANKAFIKSVLGK